MTTALFVLSLVLLYGSALILGSCHRRLYRWPAIAAFLSGIVLFVCTGCWLGWV